MELSEFKTLSETGQWNELWENGKHLTSLKYIDKKFSLYALHKFFVEVELSAMDKIVGMKIFKSRSLMEKYVEKIDL